MQEHPFIEFVRCRVAGIVAWLVLFAVNAYILIFYAALGWELAWMDSIIYGILFAAFGFLYWYVTDILRAVQAQAALALIVQALCIGGSFATQLLVVQESTSWFAYLLPIRFIFGLACWIILVQWYRIRRIAFRQVVEQPCEMDPEQPCLQLTSDNQVLIVFQ